MLKTMIGIDVLEAAKRRISDTFDSFDKAYVSLSGGKDSTALFYLVIAEARRRNRKIGVFILDWECQYQYTADHLLHLVTENAEHIDLYWICLEIETSSACSYYEPMWRSWDENKKELWTRKKPAVAIADGSLFPFYYPGITFEEFTPAFGDWYADGQECACFVGIRAQESLNRHRAVTSNKVSRFKGRKYTTIVSESVCNVYPIFDWLVDDIWTFFAKEKLQYNRVYDLMHQAGLSPSQMRIDEPFGDEARKNLWLYQIIEPVTWSKFVARLAGINSASLYSQEKGNILGNEKVSLPPGHTWESFAKFLLGTMPEKTSLHYENKIAVYLKWYYDRGYETGIPDAANYRMEQIGKAPSWRLIVKILLRNDWYCRGLGFGITKTNAYKRYLELMAKRRKEWNII
jgi:predicted phosphoadenosine phosphosulfate sulfurtransferase